MTETQRRCAELAGIRAARAMHYLTIAQTLRAPLRESAHKLAREAVEDHDYWWTPATEGAPA